MNRRAFLAIASAYAVPPSLAQGRIPVVGVLKQKGNPYLEVLRQGFREIGHIENRTIVLDAREVTPDEFPVHAADLARARVDVIVAFDSQATDAARQATTTIPIVIAGASDPIGTGFV